MVIARTIADGLSISRVFLGIAFILLSQSGTDYFSISVWILIIAQLTDHADGFIARKFTKPTLTGYMLDSLGDKVFYVAVIIVFNSQGIYDMMLSWALITREITLYIARICNMEKTKKVKTIHIYSRLHGLFIRVSFVFAMISLYQLNLGTSNDVCLLLANISGWFAFLIAMVGLFFFMRL